MNIDFENSMNFLWAFIRHSDTVRDYRERLENASRDQQLINALTASLSDATLNDIRTTLSDPSWEADWPDLRLQLLRYPSREAIQKSVQARFDQSDKAKVFAWFVQDANGLQLAHEPIGKDNIGKNYAWRTYFHGGEADFRNLKDYLENGASVRLTSTKLSEPFLTESTQENVIGVSTPVESKGRFLGVVGVFLFINPPRPNGEIAAR